jgi:two-component system sensor histidine kinase HydH
VNAALIRDGERKAAGYAYLFADVTNIKQLEEQLRRSERLASMGSLAAGVAHELRNPLSSIKGFATILAGRAKDDERSQKLAGVMVQEVDRLNRVVSELLDFARPTELHRQPHGCRELIEKSLRLIEGDAAHMGVKIETRIDPENLRVEVDPDRFSQVLLNLYLNGLQAMEGGGTLRVLALREENRTLFCVTDSGKGICQEDLPHIFDPYFTTKPSGVGLGLANVHKFVEAHGGKIEVDSAPGKGARFTVRLHSLEEQSSP